MRANKRFFVSKDKTMLESMDKEKAKNKSPTIMRGLKERNHRLGACEKNFKEGYGKKEKKKRES